MGPMHLAVDAKPWINVSGAIIARSDERTVLRYGRLKNRRHIGGKVGMLHGIAELAAGYGDDRLARRIAPGIRDILRRIRWEYSRPIGAVERSGGCGRRVAVLHGDWSSTAGGCQHQNHRAQPDLTHGSEPVVCRKVRAHCLVSLDVA